MSYKFRSIVVVESLFFFLLTWLIATTIELSDIFRVCNIFVRAYVILIFYYNDSFTLLWKISTYSSIQQKLSGVHHFEFLAVPV